MSFPVNGTTPPQLATLMLMMMLLMVCCLSFTKSKSVCVLLCQALLVLPNDAVHVVVHVLVLALPNDDNL